MNEMLYYKCILTALSPVHIGGGHEISKKDCLYMPNEKKVCIMDSMKVFEGMKKRGLLRDYEKYLLDEKQKNFTFFIRDHNIPPAEYKGWTAYTLPLDDITVDQSRSKGGGSDNIAAFIKDAYGCPYIPGSSLKGALRTIIQNSLIEKDRDKFKGIAAKIPSAEFKSRTKYLSYENNDIAQELFFTFHEEQVKNGKLKKGNAVNDIFRGLRISDSKPLSVSDLILCQKIDVLPDGTQKSLPIKRECLRPGTRITFDIEIDRGFIKLSDTSILKAVDVFYNMYRKDFLSAFQDAEPANAAEHMLYIGGGTGFATKTSVYPLFADRDKAVSAVQSIMVNTTSTRREHDPHKHANDSRRYHVSPHMRKRTRYRRVFYDMGLCGIEIIAK